MKALSFSINRHFIDERRNLPHITLGTILNVSMKFLIQRIVIFSIMGFTSTTFDFQYNQSLVAGFVRSTYINLKTSVIIFIPADEGRSNSLRSSIWNYLTHWAVFLRRPSNDIIWWVNVPPLLFFPVFTRLLSLRFGASDVNMFSRMPHQRLHFMQFDALEAGEILGSF